jgi:hypothetical protein
MSRESASRAVEFASNPAAASTMKRTALMTNTATRMLLCLTRNPVSSRAFVWQQSSIRLAYDFLTHVTKWRDPTSAVALVRVAVNPQGQRFTSGPNSTQARRVGNFDTEMNIIAAQAKGLSSSARIWIAMRTWDSLSFYSPTFAISPTYSLSDRC